MTTQNSQTNATGVQKIHRAKRQTSLCDVLTFLSKSTHREKAILLDTLIGYAQTGKIIIHFNDIPLANVIRFIATSDQREFRSILKTVEGRRAQ